VDWNPRVLGGGESEFFFYSNFEKNKPSQGHETLTRIEIQPLLKEIFREDN